MPIINKTKRTAAIFNRGREVVKVYDHGKLAWQKQSSIPDYLCFTALEAGQFTLTIPAAVTPTHLSYVEWSKDGRTWNHTDNTSEAVTIQVDVASGDKVYWRGSGIQYMTNDSRVNNYFNQASYFSSSNRFDVSGNIMSMLYADGFDGKTSFPGTSSQYYNIGAMFQHCEYLVHAADLLLPATTLKHLCYTGMFFYCGSLLDAPSLPATDVSNANYCYRYMFQGCSSLITPPDLSHVTTTARSGFYAMFYDCSSLTTATLPQASHLLQYCYYCMYRGCTSITSADLSSARTINTHACENMFYGCSSLSHVKCLATDISANGCLTNWLYGVSSTGIFIQAEGVEWPRGASGIPTGWVDIEKRTMPTGYKQVEYLLNPNYGYININRAFEANAETLEVAFVKQATGASMPFGSSIHNYRYGSVKVTEQATALAVNVGIDFANQVNKIVSIASVTADTPRTLRYEGNASGFEVYLDGVSKSTQTCAWDAVNPFASNMVFSASTNASSTVYFHTKPIFYVKIWDGNGALALDYVAAVRESDGVAGFYDMANNVFHKSDNANDFTAGEEI